MAAIMPWTAGTVFLGFWERPGRRSPASSRSTSGMRFRQGSARRLRGASAMSSEVMRKGTIHASREGGHAIRAMDRAPCDQRWSHGCDQVTMMMRVHAWMRRPRNASAGRWCAYAKTPAQMRIPPMHLRAPSRPDRTSDRLRYRLRHSTVPRGGVHPGCGHAGFAPARARRWARRAWARPCAGAETCDTSTSPRRLAAMADRERIRRREMVR